MFCPKCGTANDDNTYRCTQCTTIIQTASAPPEVAVGDSPVMRAILPVGRSGYAIAAGYLGLLSILGVTAPLALIFSILAIRDIKKNPQKHGMGRAIFGLIMGALGTLVMLTLIFGKK